MKKIISLITVFVFASVALADEIKTKVTQNFQHHPYTTFKPLRRNF